MTTMTRSALAAPLLAFTALGMPGPSGTSGLFNQYVGFGDSTLDRGYFRYETTGSVSMDPSMAAAVAQGGSGVMNFTFLEGRFGLNGGASAAEATRQRRGLH